MAVAILVMFIMVAMLIAAMPPVFGEQSPYKVCQTHQNNNYKQYYVHAFIIRLDKKTGTQK